MDDRAQVVILIFVRKFGSPEEAQSLKHKAESYGHPSFALSAFRLGLHTSPVKSNLGYHVKSMNALFYIVNGLVMPPAMSFAYNYYKFHGKEIRFRRLWVSMGILFITVVPSTLQFIFPAIIPALNLNGDALRAGEYWRLITPAFIQPWGIWHCAINAVFFCFFVPITEHFYGRGLLLIYFGAVLIAQVTNAYWQTTPGGIPTAGGGSSSGTYGTIGALFTYILLYRNTFPKGYIWLSIAGFVGAIILLFFEDGHGISVLTGGLLGLVIWKFWMAGGQNKII